MTLLILQYSDIFVQRFGRMDLLIEKKTFCVLCVHLVVGVVAGVTFLKPAG